VNFLSEGFGELGRKLGRWRLRRAMRQHDADRLVALSALGQKAWDDKLDLGAHGGLRDRLAGLDARAGELSQAASRLETEKTGLEKQRRTELETFAARRKAVESTKAPVDAALREARSRRAACEQLIRQAEARQAAIAGKLPALQDPAERAKLAAEQGELAPKLAAARAELPGHAAEDVRLASESQQHAAQIAAIDAEQKAAIGRIDTELARVRKELQGASQQSTAVGKDRAGTFGELGKALYDAGARDATLAEPAARVASIDRGRADAQAAHEASQVETRALPGATMAKFWGVVLGVPLVLAAVGTVAYQYLHRPEPVAAVPAPRPTVAQPTSGSCEYQKPPDNGKGAGVSLGCVRSEGTFVNGQLQSGKVTYPDGRVREGTFAGGQQYGKGTLTWRDGRRYEGLFVEGRSAGPGVFVAADGTRDSGMFRPGVKLSGLGTRTNSDGSVLLGEFVNGRPSAKMVRVKGDNAEVVTLDPNASPKGTAILETTTP
jgi:hypothetical protein